VLKEEIRTYQRSEERHKHIENLEYVKNVILKFLTLGGEERGRLVPVLATILRLSKEEVNQLHLLAKGQLALAAMHARVYRILRLCHEQRNATSGYEVYSDGMCTL
jgi:GRIP domain